MATCGRNPCGVTSGGCAYADCPNQTFRPAVAQLQQLQGHSYDQQLLLSIERLLIEIRDLLKVQRTVTESGDAN